MAVVLETSIKRFIWDTADTKPTGVPVGSTGLDRQTSILYVTYDGTNWVAKSTIAKLGANSGVDIGDVDVTSVVPGVGATNLGKAEDAAHTSGDVGVMALGVTLATPASLGADGDYQPFEFVGGKLWTVADPVVATPTDYNLTLTNADTEYSQAMPANCRRFEFQCRTEVTVRHAVVTGKVAASTAPFLTLKAGDYYDSGPINQGASPSTLYFASATAGVIMEIRAWV